jgi:hypothetical protein
MKDINSKLELHPHTYYFSIAGGARQRNYMK